MAISILHTYLAELRHTAAAPNTTEHSYRPAIGQLIESLATHLNRPLHQLTLEPGHVTVAGASDAVLYGPTVNDSAVQVNPQIASSFFSSFSLLKDF